MLFYGCGVGIWSRNIFRHADIITTLLQRSITPASLIDLCLQLRLVNILKILLTKSIKTRNSYHCSDKSLPREVIFYKVNSYHLYHLKSGNF